jgi:hypothetical protein
MLLSPKSITPLSDRLWSLIRDSFPVAHSPSQYYI